MQVRRCAVVSFCWSSGGEARSSGTEGPVTGKGGSAKTHSWGQAGSDANKLVKVWALCGFLQVAVVYGRGQGSDTCQLPSSWKGSPLDPRLSRPPSEISKSLSLLSTFGCFSNCWLYAVSTRLFITLSL